jgi:hypothetical protein
MSAFTRVMEELGWPYIFQVPREQWVAIEHEDPEDACAINSYQHPICYVRQSVRGRAKLNTIYHEIFDKIFPRWPHWKVALAAQVMARGGHRGEETEGVDRHSINELPDRARLLVLARRAVIRYNARVMPRSKRCRVRSGV